MRAIIFLISIMFLTNIIYSQTDYDYKLERHKFNINLIDNQKNGKTIIKKINDNEQFEGVYLGEINTIKDKKYFLLYSSYVFNINNIPTAENHIFIYTIEKKYVGFYYVSKLPIKLDNNILYFNCEKTNSKVKISFNKGIPRFINIKCNNENNFIEFQN